MSDDSIPEPWSIDPTLRFSHIHIIESLPSGFAGRSGLRLFEALRDIPDVKPATVEYHSVRSKGDFRALMLTIVSQAELGRFPLLHFEAHGEHRQPGKATTSRGIVLASGELVSWRELGQYLVQINGATRLRLLVFVATCFGADILTLVQPLERAPARVLVGPRETISMGLLEHGALTFYRSLIMKGDGGQALLDMQDTTDGAFLPYGADELFRMILRDYYNELTTEPQIAARVEMHIAELVLRGVPSAEIDFQRKWMKARLRDRKAVFDMAYRKFFFIDVHPENRDRFRMTFENTFQEAGDGAADDSSPE